MSATREGFLDRIVRDPHDKTLRLVFADWLEENGDPHLGAYIRARCAIDGCVPDAEAYPTLIERCLESLAGERKPDFAVPPGFEVGCWWDAFKEEWWSDSWDAMEGGLLSFVYAERDGGDADADLIIRRVDEMVRTTPVRGIDFRSEWPSLLPAILASEAVRPLRRLEFDDAQEQGRASPALQALLASPLARTLTRLQLGAVWPSDAARLAAAPFGVLERFEAMLAGFSAAEVETLQTAPWFRRLRRLRIGYGPDRATDGARGLAGMAHLHSLDFWGDVARCVLGLGSTGELPGLRRLLLNGGDLKGEPAAALARLNAPKLLDLWLNGCAMGLADIKSLAASPLFSGLRILTLGVKLTHTALAPVADSACSPHLRILRIRNAAMQSLAKSALARPGVFPSLTTLALSSPYSGSAKVKDTAALLAKLDLPDLRHLELGYCDFDDACADLIATRPTFAGLTRLVIREAAKGADAPTANTLRKMLCSENLRHLVVLELWNVPVGDAPDALADPTVMPNLTTCTFYEGAGRTGKRLDELRAGVRHAD